MVIRPCRVRVPHLKHRNALFLESVQIADYMQRRGADTNFIQFWENLGNSLRSVVLIAPLLRSFNTLLMDVLICLLYHLRDQITFAPFCAVLIV